MTNLVTPNKITQFCIDVIKDFCVPSKTPITIKPDELSPENFLLQGGNSELATSTNGRRTPVVLLKNGYWMHFSMKMIKHQQNKSKSHSLEGLSCQIYQETSEEKILLFRAEWDNKIPNKYKHPQPHWHFHPQVDYSFDGNKVDADSFKTFLDLTTETDFEVTGEKAAKASENLTKFHFAMCAKWNDNKSAITVLTEDSLNKWLPLLMESIDLQLAYSFN